MTQGRSTPEDASAQRRFRSRARLWILAILVLAAALLFAGQFALALAVIAAGLVGFVIVFDARRPWWGTGLGATAAAAGQRQTDRRAKMVLAVVLVLVTVLTWAAVLFLPR